MPGRFVEVIAAVVNGSANFRLRPLTADASGLPVVAGPIADTALASGLPQPRMLAVSRGSRGNPAAAPPHPRNIDPTSRERR